MKELSVFVDESGDFGLYYCHSPTYLFTMVFHDQKDDISQLIKAFIHELNQIDPTMVYFHAGPLIRREDDYKDMDILLRRRAFNKMSFLANHLPIRYVVIRVQKKQVNEPVGMSFSLAKPFGRVLRERLSFFQKFDLVKIYYDNGQKELTKLLVMLFGAFINAVEYKIVNPRDYALFQVADYLSTLELIRYKFEEKNASKSEIYFFGSSADFYRNYYRHVQSKKL